MREILQRGKLTKINGWVYGSFVIDGEKHSIYNKEKRRWIPVDKQSVGQFTGAYDCCGNRIYEGDILRHTIQTPNYNSRGFAVGVTNLIPEHAVVEWNECACAFIGVWLPRGEPEKGVPPAYVMSYMTEWEIIGNIYDNPELLEETNG